MPAVRHHTLRACCLHAYLCVAHVAVVVFVGFTAYPGQTPDALSVCTFTLNLMKGFEEGCSLFVLVHPVAVLFGSDTIGCINSLTEKPKPGQARA
mgnify:CR=1 FL=1